MGLCESGQTVSQFRKLKTLIPFFEAQGFVVWRNVDSITIFPDQEAFNNKGKHKVEVKVNGGDTFKDLEESIKKTVLEYVDKAINKVRKYQTVSKDEV